MEGREINLNVGTTELLFCKRWEFLKFSFFLLKFKLPPPENHLLSDKTVRKQQKAMQTILINE